jgi:hypothetical protein
MKLEEKILFKDMDELRNFIFAESKSIIGDKGMIGSAVIVFEFIDEDGDAGYSLLRPPGANWEESLNLLFRASKVIEKSVERDNGAIFDEDDDKGF